MIFTINSVNEQAIELLKTALAKTETTLKINLSPETDPTWEERRKNAKIILANIEARKKKRATQTNIQWLDSTELIREGGRIK